MKLQLVEELTLDELIQEYKKADDRVKSAKADKEHYSALIDAELVARRDKSAETGYGDKVLRVTRVANRRFTVDTAGLVKKLGKRKLHDLFKPLEIDRAKLNAAIESPEYDFGMDEVAPYVHMSDNPYIRVSVVERKEGDEPE